jgi:hypothetical protein
MNTEPRSEHGGGAERGESWTATFSVLDFSSVISSSQWRRLLAAIKRFWR